MKVATIGTGMIAEWFLHSVEDNEGVECIGIYSRNEATGRTLADKFNVKTVYTNLDEMLAVEEIEFIYIASPNSLHYEQTLHALQAGKHVICEKPFTSTLKQLDHLIEVANAKKLFLFEAIVTIHMPNYQVIKEQLSRLGDIRMVQCNFSQYSSKYDKYIAGEIPNVFSLDFSGGALSDINIYCLHFTVGLFGTPKDVHYYPNIGRNGIDTSGVVILEYDGFKAVCIGCKDTKSECITQIQGEKGYITLRSEPSRCKEVEVHIGKEDVINPTIPQKDIALYYEVKDFHKIYKDQDYAACNALLAHSRRVLEVYEKARIDGGILFPCDK